MWALLVLAALALAWWTGRSQVRQVAWTEAREVDYLPSFVGSGEVVPAATASLAAMTSGRVEEVLVQEGDLVAAGQLLVVLERGPAQLELRQAQAEVAAAEARYRQGVTLERTRARVALEQALLQLEEAERAHQRLQALAAQGAVSQVEAEDAERRVRQARSAVEKAEVELESWQPDGSQLASLHATYQRAVTAVEAARLQLGYCDIASPWPARVLRVSVAAGERVQAGDVVVEVGAVQPTRVRVRADQRLERILKAGNPAWVWAPADPDDKWSGTVARVDARADAAQGTRGVEVELTTARPELAPGTVVSVQLLAAAPERAILLADRWLGARDGEPGVWLEQSGRARFAPVQLGERGPAGVVVRAGLQAGSRVLDPAGLTEGQRVTPGARR
jgi:HlyD family secretion protein